MKRRRPRVGRTERRRTERRHVDRDVQARHSDGHTTVDRELLIEIGTEELPASWLPSLTRQFGEHLAARLTALRLPPDAPVETFSTPRRLTVARGPDARAAVGPRGADQRAGRRRPRSSPTASRRRPRSASRASTASRCRRSSASRRRRASTSRYRKHQRGRAAVDVLPDVLAARPARHGVPQADALGRLARGRPRRAAVRPPDPLDPVPLRRPRRAVHDPPERGRAVGPRAGGPVGRRHLRPPVPGDQRPRGARHQGAVASTSTARS